MRRTSASNLLLCTAMVACASTSPSDLPPEQFGAIVALVRGRPWISDPSSDSVVATYDPSSQRLIIGGSRTDRYGYHTGLALDICAALEQRTYAFASTPNGPFGFDAMKLGVLGQWWEPAETLPERVTGPYVSLAFSSRGGPDDELVIEQIDLLANQIRGSFRFQAFSPTGQVVASISGRFSGRLAQRSARCSIP